MGFLRWLFGEDFAPIFCIHKWENCILFQFRTNIFTGENERLLQCQKCGVIKHIKVTPEQVLEIAKKEGISLR